MDAKDNDGMSAAHWCYMMGHIDCGDWLLNDGQATKFLRDNAGKIPCDYKSNKDFDQSVDINVKGNNDCNTRENHIVGQDHIARVSSDEDEDSAADSVELKRLLAHLNDHSSNTSGSTNSDQSPTLESRLSSDSEDNVDNNINIKKGSVIQKEKRNKPIMLNGPLHMTVGNHAVAPWTTSPNTTSSVNFPQKIQQKLPVYQHHKSVHNAGNHGTSGKKNKYASPGNSNKTRQVKLSGGAASLIARVKSRLKRPMDFAQAAVIVDQPSHVLDTESIGEGYDSDDVDFNSIDSDKNIISTIKNRDSDGIDKRRDLSEDDYSTTDSCSTEGSSESNDSSTGLANAECERSPKSRNIIEHSKTPQKFTLPQLSPSYMRNRLSEKAQNHKSKLSVGQCNALSREKGNAKLPNIKTIRSNSAPTRNRARLMVKRVNDKKKSVPLSRKGSSLLSHLQHNIEKKKVIEPTMNKLQKRSNRLKRELPTKEKKLLSLHRKARLLDKKTAKLKKSSNLRKLSENKSKHMQSLTRLKADQKKLRSANIKSRLIRKGKSKVPRQLDKLPLILTSGRKKKNDSNNSKTALDSRNRQNRDQVIPVHRVKEKKVIFGVSALMQDPEIVAMLGEL